LFAWTWFPARPACPVKQPSAKPPGNGRIFRFSQARLERALGWPFRPPLGCPPGLRVSGEISTRGGARVSPSIYLPAPLVSVSTTNGRLKSSRTRTRADVRAYLRATKASCCCSVQTNTVPLRSKLVKGREMRRKCLTKRL
jgi:hypothetical protein